MKTFRIEAFQDERPIVLRAGAELVKGTNFGVAAARAYRALKAEKVLKINVRKLTLRITKID